MSTTFSNFLKFAATVSGTSVPVLLAVTANSSASMAQTLSATLLDKFTVDLSSAGYPKNGAFFLALAASTPITVDLTTTSTAATATAGDTTFATAYELVLANPSAQDVVVSPGASNGFNGPLGGTAPAFTVPAGARLRWQCPAGWSITSVLKNLKFDPGSAAAAIGVSLGGA